jgi:hypothetical protein
LEPPLEDAYLAALATHRNGAHRLAAV